MSTIVLTGTCLVAVQGCATRPDDTTVLHPPLDDQQVEQIREEADGRRAELQLEGSLQPRAVSARLWSVGSDSLRYVPAGLHGEPLTVPLGDVSWIAFPRGRGEMAVRAALDGARDGAFRALFEEAFCAGSFRPDCSADYGGAFRTGAFSGAAIGLLGALIGGDRTPAAHSFSPTRK